MMDGKRQKLNENVTDVVTDNRILFPQWGCHEGRKDFVFHLEEGS